MVRGIVCVAAMEAMYQTQIRGLCTISASYGSYGSCMATVPLSPACLLGMLVSYTASPRRRTAWGRHTRTSAKREWTALGASAANRRRRRAGRELHLMTRFRHTTGRRHAALRGVSASVISYLYTCAAGSPIGISRRDRASARPPIPCRAPLLPRRFGVARSTQQASTHGRGEGSPIDQRWAPAA